jgi:hypothetical protein
MHFEKTSFLVALLTATVFAVPAMAGKYCVQGSNLGYPGDCSYSTYAQCEASASGTIDGCGINPRYAYARQGGYSNRRTRRY